MVCIVMAYIVMAYIVMARIGYGLPAHSVSFVALMQQQQLALYGYGLYSYGLYSYGLYSYGAYRSWPTGALCLVRRVDAAAVAGLI